jgi:hypothetical protein
VMWVLRYDLFSNQRHGKALLSAIMLVKSGISGPYASCRDSCL